MPGPSVAPATSLECSRPLLDSSELEMSSVSDHLAGDWSLWSPAAPPPLDGTEAWLCVRQYLVLASGKIHIGENRIDR